MAKISRREFAFAHVSRLIAGIFALFMLPANSGCVGTLSQLIYFVSGNKEEARCNALEGSRIAVVCVAGSGLLQASGRIEDISQHLSMLLAVNVSKCEVIPSNTVRKWRDDHHWDEVDFISLGKGVNADKVVAIDVFGLEIDNSGGVSRGRASVKTTVYDLRDKGRIVYRKGPDESEFPASGVTLPAENSVNFERSFLDAIARRIAMDFYSYDRIEAVAEAATLQRL